ADVVLRIRGSILVDALGLPQRRSAIDEGRLIVSHPLHPRVHPLLLLLRGGVFHHILEVVRVGHIQHQEFLHWMILSPVRKRREKACCNRLNPEYTVAPLAAIDRLRRGRTLVGNAKRTPSFAGSDRVSLSERMTQAGIRKMAADGADSLRHSGGCDKPKPSPWSLWREPAMRSEKTDGLSKRQDPPAPFARSTRRRRRNSATSARSRSPAPSATSTCALRAPGGRSIRAS